MMDAHREEEFQDPALKQAIGRCWASERASAALRTRIAKLCADMQPLQAKSTPSAKSKNPGNRFSWMIWPASVAALLLISVAVFNRMHTPPHQVAIALPAGLESDLISRHDNCCKEPDHQHLPGVSKNDDTAIARALRTSLNQPVAVFHPADSHWVFKGASVCPVGSTPSGHLVFVKSDARGEAALSIFSLPLSVLLPSMPNAHDGDQYSATVNQHQVVGFVKNGALFCMVSSGPAGTLDLDELKKMETRMQPCVAIAPRTNTLGDKILLTELLQPIH